MNRVSIYTTLVVVAFTATSSQPTYDFNVPSKCGCHEEIEMLQTEIALLKSEIASIVNNDNNNNNRFATTTRVTTITTAGRSTTVSDTTTPTSTTRSSNLIGILYFICILLSFYRATHC